jgi:putative phosphoesterase
LPEECVRQLERADLILHAGDVVTLAVLRELEAFARVEAVHGNMDEAALQQVLPERRVVEVGGTRIGMVHVAGAAAGREERLASWFPDSHAAVYGHTHVPQVERHRGLWILNPGSPTERRRAPERSMLVLEIAEGVLEPQLVKLP